MIESLSQKYNIDEHILLRKGKNINYEKLDTTLDFLINELKLFPTNLTNCSAIIFQSKENIKKNIKFIEREKIKFTSIETCLLVLSNNPKSLINRYDYISKHYGKKIIEEKPAILNVTKKRIIGIEDLNIPIKDNKDIIKIALGPNSIRHMEELLNSKEYQEHKEIFTLDVFSRAKITDIREMLSSEEYQKHKELFTSDVLAKTKLKYIKELLNLPYWQDDKYKQLLTSSLVAKAKSLLKKMPVLIKMAEDYGIDEYLTTSYLLFSPSQNYALIRYMNENNIPLVVDNKLNKMFGKAPIILKKKYNIDLKELMKMYPLEEKGKVYLKK